MKKGFMTLLMIWMISAMATGQVIDDSGASGNSGTGANRHKEFQFPTSDIKAGFHFTSFPDLFNWNINYPQPGWDEAINWFLDGMKKEGPAFSLNAGDIMDARWWSGPDEIKQKTEQYWQGFKKRFDDKNIKLYIAPGDHEYGDDRGMLNITNALVFGEQFNRIFNMPQNGPAHKKGRAYYITKENLLVISLDTFEEAGDRMNYTVGDAQLDWMEEVLKQNKDKEFIIVQGHLPVVGPVASKNSSASMYGMKSNGGQRGTEARLWEVMVKYGVDVYLCGEHHRITCTKRDGIWQIVHGALWGTQEDLNYLRGSVDKGRLTLELFEFNVEYSGGFLDDHPNRGKGGPREKVAISPETLENGPKSAGKLIIENGPNGKKDTEATGWFKKAAEVTK